VNDIFQPSADKYLLKSVFQTHRINCMIAKSDPKVGDLVWSCPVGLSSPRLGLVLTNPDASRNCEVSYPDGIELNGVAILHASSEAAAEWGKKTLRSLGWHVHDDI
jgi:hypothetical protein